MHLLIKLIINRVIGVQVFLLLKDINQEIKEYLELFKNPQNPIYLSLIVVSLLFIFLYMMVRYVVFPLKREHALEEKELKLQNLKLMALFADLDPDPLLRLDKEGKVIVINPAARESGFGLLMGKDLKSVLPGLNINFEELIEKDLSVSVSEEYLDKYYELQINGISSLQIVQIYFHDITELTKNQRALEESQKELKEFSRNLQLRIEEERQRISTELHDDVGQNLLLLRLNLQRRFNEITGETNSPFFSESTQILDKVVTDLKGISYSLKPMVLKELGLVPALIALVNKVKQESGINGTFGENDMMDRRFDQNLETAIYRVVQEALNNIVKYSKAKEFNIELINNGKKIHLIISDDGVGFDREKIKNKHGMGISNMRERTEAFNGTFRLNSSAEEGTIIIADFPLEVS